MANWIIDSQEEKAVLSFLEKYFDNKQVIDKCIIKTQLHKVNGAVPLFAFEIDAQNNKKGELLVDSKQGNSEVYALAYIAETPASDFRKRKVEDFTRLEVYVISKKNLKQHLIELGINDEVLRSSSSELREYISKKYVGKSYIDDADLVDCCYPFKSSASKNKDQNAECCVRITPSYIDEKMPANLTIGVALIREWCETIYTVEPFGNADEHKGMLNNISNNIRNNISNNTSDGACNSMCSVVDYDKSVCKSLGIALPKYSKLIYGVDYSPEMILELLENDIKVIYFNAVDASEEKIADRINEFKKAGFLYVFDAQDGECDNADFYEHFEIDDGNLLFLLDGARPADNRKNADASQADIEALAKNLSARYKSFNNEQYVVEHASKDAHMIVTAGAGTGKTHVMIDRIMCLAHIDEEFSFAKVAMMTFTNKATGEMKTKLYEYIKSKYSLLAHNPMVRARYLVYMEELSQMKLSTIHSFFYNFFKENGYLLGFGNDIALTNFADERRQIVKKLLKEYYNKAPIQNRVEEYFGGLTLSEAEKFMLDCWKRVGDWGYTEAQIKKIDWGNAAFKHVMDKVYKEYKEILLSSNAIQMQDIIHYVGELFEIEGVCKILKEKISQRFSYVFCDEFQDCNLVQVRAITRLMDMHEASLFVVGDVKQSIYRFRGAAGDTFATLKKEIGESITNRPIIEKSLIKNYRTNKVILDDMMNNFSCWGKYGLLTWNDEADRLVAQNSRINNPVYKKIHMDLYSWNYGKQTVDSNASEALKDFIEGKENGYKPKEITFLVRNNYELDAIREWCEDEGYKIDIKEKGAFYKEKCIRDLCALLEYFLYGEDGLFSVNIDDEIVGEFAVNLNMSCFRDYIKKAGKAKIDEYREGFVTKPVIAVIGEIIADSRVGQNVYIRMYLESMMQKLVSAFSDKNVSLKEVCEYIRLHMYFEIDEENEVDDLDVSMIEVAEEEHAEADRQIIRGMTVHSSKGLSCDAVIIPFMKNLFFNENRNELLLPAPDDESVQKAETIKVGWKFVKKTKSESGDRIVIKQSNPELEEREKMETIKEETRLLYVALTRTMNAAICLTGSVKENELGKNDGIEKWQDLMNLSEGGKE